MTVEELRMKLGAMPDEAQVLIEHDGGHYPPGCYSGLGEIVLLEGRNCRYVTISEAHESAPPLVG